MTPAPVSKIPSPKPVPLTLRKTIGSIPECAVELDPDGGAIVHFRISPQDWSRYQRRFNRVDPAGYLWFNVLRSAILGHIW